ncbi:MAG: TIGR04283 family arsenosugar biosynthesis glycosyltransferase [Candidatus Omnitrophica bacterium]|nr:TIGR04283 family arsenosugar biosynthesis glycosyltransferase [Candidatus Omnitrophota bacterium]
MISIIIPVYNEEAVIDRTLSALPFGKGIEVIVVDGQSEDRTMEIVSRYLVKSLTSFRSRAIQMNAGAAVAQGDILLFLHADCLLEKVGLKAIEKYVSLNFVGGCFTHKIDSPKRIYRWIEVSGHLRAELFKIFYGDQAIFVRRDIFERMGGFKTVPLFEDVIFSRRLRHLGKTIILDNPATVLPRRWEKGGLVKTMVLNWLLSLGFILGVPTERLARFYKNVR